MSIEVPNGLDAIIETFGSLDDPAFEDKNIVLFDLPYPLLYDGREVKRTRCHRLMVEIFQEVFREIEARDLISEAKNYGGIYAKRGIRGRESHPSTHCWGIAIDLEPKKYPLGSLERMPDELVEIFTDKGFVYGGDFRGRKDPQHYQFCRY